MADKKRVVGFDMGGTKMLAVVLDEELKQVSKAKIRTPVGASDKETFAAVVKAIREALDKGGTTAEELEAIGIAVPGPIDRAEGKIIELPNVGMRDYPMRDKLQKELGAPVVLENDVNAGTYGEFAAGAAKGFRNVVGVFPGTGVGGGIIIGGRLYRGTTGRAGEVGHLVVEAGGRMCGCGKYGCLEAVASKTAIAKDLVHLAMNGLAPTILAKAGTDIAKIKSGLIRKAVENGEKAVLRVVERAAWYIGIGVGSCIDLFDPDVVVIGGGLIEKLGDRYLKPIIRSAREHSMIATNIPIVAAAFGDDSVVTGAAVLARREIRGE